MITIDAQVHAYERNHPGRPWAAVLHGPPQVTGDDMVAAMDAVGVDGAMLVSPFTMYRYDASYAIEVHAAHPGRFALDQAGRSDRSRGGRYDRGMGGEGWRGRRPDHDDARRVDRCRRSRHQPGSGRCRATLPAGQSPVLGAPGAGRTAGGSQPRHAAGDRPSGTAAAVRAAGARAALCRAAEGAELAAHDNVTIKISGACTLSHEPFPYNDIWDPLGRIFDAYGFERCMWGTDWTRAVALLTYKQGVEAFRVTDRLSDSDRAALMGGTLQRVYDWSPKKA